MPLESNAQHAAGAKTAPGSKKRSLNALRHGVHSIVVVLPNEDQDAYEDHLKSFIDEYRPQGATESQLVQVLAETSWRQNRVTVLEGDLLMFSPRTFVDFESQGKALASLSLHNQRLSRQFDCTVNQLRKLQKTRTATQVPDQSKQVSGGAAGPQPAPGFVFADSEAGRIAGLPVALEDPDPSQALGAPAGPRR